MLKDVDFIAGLGAISFAIAQAILAEQGIPLLEGTVFEMGPGAAATFGLVALGRWYSRGRAKQRREAESIEQNRASAKLDESPPEAGKETDE